MGDFRCWVWHSCAIESWKSIIGRDHSFSNDASSERCYLHQVAKSHGESDCRTYSPLSRPEKAHLDFRTRPTRRPVPGRSQRLLQVSSKPLAHFVA
jgi:hypothetical protein